jgi:hypothetical protein
MEGTETGGDQVPLPRGAALKPPVSLDDLRTGIEHDPEGAEEFVAQPLAVSPIHANIQLLKVEYPIRPLPSVAARLTHPNV